MLHNHLRNFTSHELLIDLDSTDESDYGTDCINQFCAGIEISGHELCRFGDTCRTCRRNSGQHHNQSFLFHLFL